MTSLTLNLLQHRRISAWTPNPGDIILYVGWINRWVGVVNGIENHNVSIIHAGTPTELMSYTQSEIDKNTISVDIGKIQRSRGQYSIHGIESGIGVWYV